MPQHLQVEHTKKSTMYVRWRNRKLWLLLRLEVISFNVISIDQHIIITIIIRVEITGFLALKKILHSRINLFFNFRFAIFVFYYKIIIIKTAKEIKKIGGQHFYAGLDVIWAMTRFLTAQPGLAAPNPKELPFALSKRILAVTGTSFLLAINLNLIPFQIWVSSYP